MSVFEPYAKGDFITIKTSVKSILKDEKDFPIINNMVILLHEISVITMQFLRLFILYKYNRNEMHTLPEFTTDNIKYFIRACGIRDPRGARAKNRALEHELDTFYNDEFSPLLNFNERRKEKFEMKNMSYATAYVAINIATAINNNIEMHFITRLRRVMNVLKPYGISDKDFRKIKNKILSDDLMNIPEEYQLWARFIKSDYLPAEYHKSYAYDVKGHAGKYLMYTLKMAEDLEQLNKVYSNYYNNNNINNINNDNHDNNINNNNNDNNNNMNNNNNNNNKNTRNSLLTTHYWLLTTH